MDASRQIAGWALAAALAVAAPAQTVRKHRVPENPNQATITQAETAIGKKDFATAEKLLKEATTADPKAYRAWYDLGYLYTLTERRPEAIAAYRKSVEANPEIFESQLNLGLALAAAGDPQAATYLRAATRLKPSTDAAEELYRAWFALGRVTEKTQPAEAAAAFAAASKLNPKDPQAHFYAGVLLERQKNFPGAEGELKQALAVDPKNAETVAALANLYMETKRLSEAEAMIREYLQIEPNSAAAHLQLGRVLAAEGKNDAATAEFQAAQRIAPQDPDAQREMAQTYYSAGKYKEAAALYGQIAEKSPDAQIYYRLGDALLRAKDFPNAQAALVKAVQIKPDFADAYGALAMAASENKQYDITVKALDLRARNAPETAGTWFLRATALDHLRDYKNASAAYKQFLALANGKYPDQEWQARHRLIAIDPEKKKR